MTDTVIVRPVVFTDRLPRMRWFLELLGLRARVESKRAGWVDMVAGGRLGFETQEPLTELAERLKSAPHRDAIVLPGDFRDGLYVVFPHGHSVVVRPAPPRESV
jgi:hypothetical protein